MIDLSGRCVFVAGGSRGIGAATARMAAQTGIAVCISYRQNAEAADRVVRQIEAAGGRAIALRADVSMDGEIDSAVDAAVAELGPLRGMVVSAGVFEGAPIEQMTAALWDRAMEINARGTMLAVRAAARQMRAHRLGGSIVIFTSTAGQQGSPGYSSYAASKAAQIIFMRSMAGELGPDGIRVNCVAPGWTETDLAAPSLDALGRETLARRFALGRIGRPEDAAGAALFLLSDLASFITGSTVTVDGGFGLV